MGGFVHITSRIYRIHSVSKKVCELRFPAFQFVDNRLAERR